MARVLARQDGGEHRQPRFDQPPRIPGPTRTALHVGGIARLRMATRLRQANPLAVTLGDQRRQRRLLDVRRGAVPGTEHAPLVPDKATLAADHPPRLARPLLAQLCGAAPCTPRGDARHAGAVCDAQHGRDRQTTRRPRRVGLAEPGQAGPCRPLGAQRPRSARHPSVKSPGPPLGAHPARPRARRHWESVWPQGVAGPPASPGPPRSTVQ
jgi:hypothetical protein